MEKILTRERAEFYLSKEGCELSVDWENAGEKEFVPTTYNGKAVLESHYPAVLTTRVFIGEVNSILQLDKPLSLPIQEIQDNAHG